MDPARIEAFHGGDRDIPTVPVRLWVHRDTIRCAIYPGPNTGVLNGYVQIPPASGDIARMKAYDAAKKSDPDRIAFRKQYFLGHDFATEGYDALTDEIEVHGGLTYGPDDQGWVGFDTGHAFDDWSNEELERVLLPDNEPVWKHFLKMQEIIGADMWPPGRVGRRHPVGWEIDWTLDRLVREVDHLAEQVYARLQGAGVLNGCC